MVYQKHIFFCLNQRENNKACCANHSAEEMFHYAKQAIKRLGLARPGGVRVNKAGCLGLCERGPVLVIYPEGVWYTYHSTSDIEEIIQSHIIENKIVQKLTITAPEEEV